MNAPTRDLLLWLEREPRTYADAVDVWRTSCPRLSTWEDAIADRLIEVVRDGADPLVVVSEQGRTALANA